ncbi:MAG TPA: PilZ domain-containing protein [Firmicutes bacterium]|nr:PilZ domain-containing protein [Bacillota bacterium]
MPLTITGAVQQKKIGVGKRVTVTAPAFGLQAQITDFTDHTLLLKILAPSACHLQDMTEGMCVTVSFVVPDDARYSFPAVISGCNKEKLLCEVRQQAAIDRLDQRSDYRLKTAKIIYLRTKKQAKLQAPHWQQACMLDISRGGASILTSAVLAVGEMLDVWIPLEEVDYALETQAEVVRRKTGEEGQLVLGVRFPDLSLPEQEKILDYILKIWSAKKTGE